jgi:two-component system OmpR family sensor kinase
VATITAQINTLNTALVWFTVGLGLLSFSIVIYGCYWLFNQLYQPIILIRGATNVIASGEYDKPISEKLDEEFEELAASINQLAKRLKEHELNELTSRTQLELDVEQRTSELTKANLELTKIDARRRQFIADVSHELRMPLTLIRGESQVTLRMKAASQEDYIETLSVILAESINLSKLVDDLLFLTRAEIHHLKLEIKETQIYSLLSAEMDRWQRHHEDRLIIITADERLKDINVPIDKSRIQQVISILLDNATKYSKPHGPVNVGIKKNESILTITVNDTGEDISAAEIENIFECFVRFSRHDEGLGLPIAKAIAEARGGQIIVKSIQGGGSIFSVMLPAGQL